ncbi:MAG: NYN domain-containing protein, partial [Huintestinicola sp.]
LDGGNISDELLRKAISKRHIFPCYFGSALKMKGIEELLEGLNKYTEEKKYPEEFGARVYKITSENGTRLTHMKITGGSLPVKTSVGNEKINQIRIYSGVKYSAPEEVFAGTVCAVTGLNSSFAGMGLGFEDNGSAPVLEPVLSYRVIFPAQIDDSVMLENLRKLEEEDPQLHVAVNSRTKEINVRLMGEIQLEILRSLVMERFGIPIDFDRGSITYKETITAPTEGIGHYEPLRHYAEVHLLMEPGEPGSGICFASAVSEDDLDRNWQRLILSNLESEPHYGVLTGAPITDIKITLAAGKAHLKHTEGGDFRQAARRAVRMGLMSTESQLLEPWYRFTLEVPSECTGRAMTDLQRMNAKFSAPEMCGEMTVITGTAPAALMMHYHTDAAGYSHGKARLNCTVCGYFPCHNAEEIIAAANYDPEADTENPPDSVFCSHGAGVTVKWYDVRGHMHVDSGIRFGEKRETSVTSAAPVHAPKEYNDEELMEIFERTYGKINRDDDKKMRRDREQNIPKHKPKPIPKGPEYLLVDGYNIIFAWDELKKLAADNLDAARSRLTDILCNYRAYRRCELILVFDAYRVKGDVRETENVNGISVIYTKEAETADMFIEKTAHDLSGEHRVRVATSDGAEQIIIMGNGAFRVSANELYDEVKAAEKAVADIISRMPKGIPTKNIINGVQK